MSSHLERPFSLLHTSCTRLLSPDLAASSQFISICSVSEQCLFFKVKSPQAKDCVSVGSREILPFAFFCFWGHVHSSPRGSSSTFKASGVWSSETFLWPLLPLSHLLLRLPGASLSSSPCGYIGPSWMTQDNFPVSRPLIPSVRSFSPWGWHSKVLGIKCDIFGGWGDIIQPAASENTSTGAL